MLRTDDVNAWAGLWMRIDGRTFERHEGFDNMQDRALRGTTEWARQDVVLDVGNGADAVAFGTLLCGTGEVRMANFRLELVPESVPVTGRVHGDPANLDFSDE